MRILVRVCSVFFVIFLIWNIYLYFTNKDSTELAVHGTIKDVISCEGQLIKNETLITAPADGVLQPYIPDCRRAPTGGAIAAILSGEADKSARKELTVIKDRIASLEEYLANKNFSEDALSLDRGIDGDIKKVVKCSESGKTSSVEEYKNHMRMLSDRKQSADGSGESILMDLRNEQKVLESKLGNLINEVYAPCAGIFSARLDGLEGSLTPDKINELSVNDIEEIKKVKSVTAGDVVRGENVCKVIDNFKWYLATVLSDKECENMLPDDNVRISFRDTGGETANAVIYHIGDSEDGKRVVTFMLSCDVQGILGRRHASIDIIRKTYEGFKVPVAALAYENDCTGVYVMEGASKVFKPCEVLYHNDDYMILKEDNTVENGLLLYDNVVVNGDVKK